VNEILSAWLDASRHKDFELIVAGIRAGGCFEHAFHRPASGKADEVLLIILFQDGERLTVSQPAGIDCTKQGNLIIAQGTEVTFSWKPRIAPEDPEAEYLEIYSVTQAGYVVLSRLVDRSLVGSSLDPDPTQAFLGGRGVPLLRLARIFGA
jgi:hypothetical protein